MGSGAEGEGTERAQYNINAVPSGQEGEKSDRKWYVVKGIKGKGLNHTVGYLLRSVNVCIPHRLVASDRRLHQGNSRISPLYMNCPMEPCHRHTHRRSKCRGLRSG